MVLSDFIKEANSKKKKLNEGTATKRMTVELSNKYRDKIQEVLDEMKVDERRLLEQTRAEGDRDYGKLKQFRRVMSLVSDLFLAIDRMYEK